MASSPCIQVCRIDEATKLCRGCGRSLREIGGWSVLPEDERLRIMAALPARLVDFEPVDLPDAGEEVHAG